MAFTGYLSDIFKPDTDEVLSSTISFENYAIFSIFRLG